MSDQFLRKASLIVTPAYSDQGRDLSQLRFRFRIGAADVETPNHVWVRVYNLSDHTVKSIKQQAAPNTPTFVPGSAEYARLTLQAGYQNGNFGVIFDGRIRQIKSGRENPTDTYLDILAQDGDIAYNFGVCNTTLAKGSSIADRQKAIVVAFSKAQPEVTAANIGQVAQATGGILPRGKVLFGMARDYQRDLCATTGTTWSIQNGKVQVLPLTGYLPGEAVVITSRTGMIGLPEQTDNGIRVRCLLNPRLQVGGLVKLDNRSIQQALFNVQFTALNLLPRLDADGLYRLYVVEHHGDTRGQEWYSELICLAVDGTAAQGSSVQAFG